MYTDNHFICNQF